MAFYVKRPPKSADKQTANTFVRSSADHESLCEIDLPCHYKVWFSQHHNNFCLQARISNLFLHFESLNELFIHVKCHYIKTYWYFGEPKKLHFWFTSPMNFFGGKLTLSDCEQHPQKQETQPVGRSRWPTCISSVSYTSNVNHLLLQQNVLNIECW